MDFERLYQENYSNVQQFCLKWTGCTDNARDIAQESFIELMQKLKGNHNLNNPISWVYRVAFNRCVNHHKFNKRFVKGNLLVLNQHESLQDNGVDSERAEKVRKAIQRLNDKEKALVTLYKLKFSYSEMASIVEINPASVGKTLARAIDKLANWVK